jgi:hypothetical protein
MKAAAATHVSPYVDVSLYPSFDLVGVAKKSGVKQFNLAFVLASGNSCAPKWGGNEALTANKVAAQISALRKAGGDVRVSFGGANGTELALACKDAGSLAAAYGKVVNAFKLTKVDFDIEGGAQANTAANRRRGQAIASLQKKHAGLKVSLTLPVLPSGLTRDGVNVLSSTTKAGAKIDAVNIMAMDYGDGVAPKPKGRMGGYAIAAATATQKQVKAALKLDDASAWRHVAVTPMIGVNDVATETFTLADARKLAAFAKAKHLAWTSLWSAARDKPCPGGPKPTADPTCSGISQAPSAFAKALD